MRVQVVERHCEVPGPVRRLAEEQMTRLRRFDARLLSAELVFQEERHLKKVEGILGIERADPVVAHGEGQEFSDAVHQVIERLGKILRRRRGQAKDHQGPKLSELPGREE